MLNINKAIVLVMTLCVLLVSPVLADTSSTQHTNYLYVQTARAATLKPVNYQQHTFTLVLKGVSSYVSYFSDRPKRESGILATQSFLMAWQQPGKNSFKQSPPNASVTGIMLKNLPEFKNTSIIVELRNPRYEQKKHLLTFDVTVLSSNAKTILNKTITLHDAVIFFDDIPWCPGCCCG